MSDHIRLSFYLDEPVFSEGQVVALEALIAEYLPNWGDTYRLSEDDAKYGSVRKIPTESLFDALNKHFPVKWGQSSAVLSGDNDRVVIFLDTSKSTVPPELNSIGVEIVDARKVNGKRVTAWAEGFFLQAVERLSVRYGCGYDKREFEAKNLARDDSGISAVGVRLGAAIPGLYWMNFFGASYVDMIGSDRFSFLPAGSAAHTTRGVLIKLGENPEEWQTPEYKSAERQIIEHLGSQYFFDRDDPEKATRAPGFKRPLVPGLKKLGS